MTNEDFIKWLEVKAHKFAANSAWQRCIENLIEEFKSEWSPANE